MHPSLPAALLLLHAAIAQAADPLPSLAVAKGGHTVSGISSGGYMAVQMHVAFSGSIRGAGVIAAGPYRCADTGVARALGPCMSGNFPFWCAFGLGAEQCRPIDAYAIARAEALAGAGRIDPLTNLAGSRVYILAGERDTRVAPQVVAAGRAFYERFGARVKFELRPGMAHTFPTLSYPGNPCARSESPFISDCRFDGAGELLKQLYPDLVAPQSEQSRGTLIEFDQRAFLTDAERARAAVAGAGLDEIGLIYVPPDCQATGACRLHVAFHGCLQGREAIGRQFAEGAGYNRWADANRLVILYPQGVGTGRFGGNPNGCWDWWGFSTPDYDTRDGLQLKAVKRMIERLEK